MRKLSKILVLVLTLSLLLGMFTMFSSANSTVAKIGDTEYTSLADAWAAALASADTEVEIDLVADAAVTAQLANSVAGKSITLDLNWYTLTSTTATGLSYTTAAFAVTAEGANLSVKNGTVSSSSSFFITSNQFTRHVSASFTNVELDWSRTSGTSCQVFYLVDLTTLRLDNFTLNSPLAGCFMTLENVADVEVRNSTIIVNKQMLCVKPKATANGTIVNYYNSNLVTAGSDAAGRTFDVWGNWSLGSGHYEVGENDVVTPAANAPTVNLYNTTVSSRGDQVIKPGAFNFNLYGGYYFSDKAVGDAKAYDAMFEPVDASGKGYGQVILHSYEVDGVTTYPTFRFDPRLDTDYPIVGIVNGEMTATKDGDTVTAITTNTDMASASGKIYATSKGWTWIPNTDTEAIAAVKADYVVSYQTHALTYTSQAGVDGAGFLKANGVTLDHKSTRAGTSHGVKDANGTAVGTDHEVVAPGIDVNGNIYYSFTWKDNLPEGYTVSDDYELWSMSNTASIGAGGDTNVTMGSVDYITIDVDVRDPNANGFQWLNNFLYNPAAGSRGEMLSKNDLVNAIGKKNGDWHHLTFVLDVNQNDIGNIGVYVFIDGEKISGKTINFGAVTAAAGLGYFRIGFAASQTIGTKIKGEGIHLDNFTVQLYGYDVAGAKDYTGTLDNIATVTNLSSLEEYADYLANENYKASIGAKFYKSYEEAYAAAVDGDIIELYADVNPGKLTKIEKAVTILTNGYEINPVSEGYQATWGGTNNCAATFAEADGANELIVYYYNTIEDFIADDDNGEYVNALASYVTNKGNVIGDDFALFGPGTGEIVYDKANETLFTISGWKLDALNEDWNSYNNGYVVYTPTPDNIEALYIVTDANGDYVSHGMTNAEFTDAMTDVASNTTLKLYKDACITAVKRNMVSGGTLENFTFDLNGKKLSYDPSVTTQDCMWAVRGDAQITFKSSMPGAEIHNYMNGGFGNKLFWFANCVADFTYEGENIAYYGWAFVSGGNAGSKFTVDGGYFEFTQQQVKYIFETAAANNEITIKDAVIYTGIETVINVGVDQTILIENTKFIGKKDNINMFKSASTQGAASVTLDNAYIYNVTLNAPLSEMTYALKNTVMTNRPLNGLTLIDEFPLSVDVKTSDSYGVVSEDTITGDFTYTNRTDLTTVTWMDGTTELLTENAIIGDTVTYNAETVEGIYKNIVSGEAVATEAPMTPAVTTEKVVKVQGMLYNLSLADEMSINLIIPEAAWAEIASVKVNGNAASAKLVSYNEANYYLVTFDGINPTTATVPVEFVIAGNDGEAAAQTLSLSVFEYAKNLLTNTDDAVEKELASSIIIYCYVATYIFDVPTTPEEIEEMRVAMQKYQSVFDLMDLPDVNNLPKNYGTSIDTSALAETALESASLLLGSAPKFVITLDDGVTEDTVVTVSYLNQKGVVVTQEFTLNENNKTATVEGMKVYDLNNTLTINVGGNDYTYDLVTYLNGLCELATDGTTEDENNEIFAYALDRYVKAAQAYQGAEPVAE